jgi:hypothetical protein
MVMALSMIFGLIMFLATVSAYSIGVRHGRVVKDGGIPNINPIRVISNVKAEAETKKEMDKFTQGLHNIMSYGEPLEKG